MQLPENIDLVNHYASHWVFDDISSKGAYEAYVGPQAESRQAFREPRLDAILLSPLV
jgi:hypothetical protein